MSTYAMQQAVFDHLRRLESGEEQSADTIRTQGYPLTDDERAALEGPDVGRLYDMGLHPVLVNALCRAMGYKKADYRVLFRPGLADEMRHHPHARWIRQEVRHG